MKITVCKYDPARDEAPYYVSGEVEWVEKMTAMEALQAFHETVEPVNFDYSCACRLCGRCAMMLDGVPAMICVTPIENKDHLYEPLAGYPVVRDLVVDKRAVDDKLSGIYDRVRVEPFTQETFNMEREWDFEHKPDLYGMEFCARCGACTAACPTVKVKGSEYAGPMTMIAHAYRYLDPLDQGNRLLDAVSDGLFHCIACGTCDQICAQQDIHHVDVFNLLKERAAEAEYKPSYA